MNHICKRIIAVFFKSSQSEENFYYLALLKNADIVYGASIHGLWPNYA